MPDIKQLTENGTQFYPETGLSAVIDGNGNDLTTLLAGKQATLVSGTNIKTVNNQSLLGSGNISISGGGGGGGAVDDVTLGGTSVVSDGVAVLPAYPTVPTISTNITTDASSDTKTASPKAVKTYVDNAGYGTYSKPSGGIPKTDLASAVQTSLGKADTALQSETSLSKGTTTGSGNAVTDISVSGHTITLTKGSTFLTSYTETDPVFTASAAHGISSSDITNWNAKQKAITVSSSTPTSSQGSNGDIWIVI